MPVPPGATWMGRADARNAVFANHFLAVSTSKPGDKNDKLRLMLLNKPAQYLLGYFAILGLVMSLLYHCPSSALAA